jgi:tetratricopeptide (TPR) repeat protein
MTSLALKDVKAFLVQHEVDYADIFERSELIARYDAVRAHITKLAEQRLRAQANRAVQRGSHELAVRLYTDALQLDGVSPELQSQLVANRSAAYLALGLASDALADALRAVELDPGHVKAFYRRGCVPGRARARGARRAARGACS